MKNIKILEVRYSATFLPIMAIKIEDEITESERYLLARAGYGRLAEDQKTYVWVSRISGGGGAITCDLYDHAGGRTLQVAHNHIAENWDSIKSGDVVDVEFILQETSKAKISESREF